MTEHESKISQLLAQFRAASSNTTTQGRYFEKFCREWLKLTPQYEEIADVRLWSDWDKRGNVADIGIDLVAETKDGEYWAIQCKFFEEESTISKDQIDSFLAAAGKSYGGASFSQLLIMTTAPLGSNAEKTIQDHTPACQVIRVDQFDDEEFDWDAIIKGFAAKGDVFFEADALRPRKTLRPHQVKAVADVKLGFQATDRGKLIMACGTGKTFTSLKIVEEIAPENGLVLYLVPSLMLLAQTLKEWTRESERAIAPIIVCSDAQAHERDARVGETLGSKKKSKNDDENDEPTFDAAELTRPATTKPEIVAARYAELQRALAKRRATEPGAERVVVVFSTYQSIQTIADAQHIGAELAGQTVFLPEFDLIVCDEAHRTTGASLIKGKDESAFVKVHDNSVISGKKRLYMTATPRVYGDAAVSKAKEKNAVLCSMDDEELYGPTFHRLSFGDAVAQNLLADYRILVLAVRDKDAEKQLKLLKSAREIAAQGSVVADEARELDDVAKMIGCWRGLSKIGRGLDRRSDDFLVDPAPMKRAVAFCRSIRDSKAFVAAFRIVSDGLVQEAKLEAEKQLAEESLGSGEAAASPDSKSIDGAREGVAGAEIHSNAPLRLELRHIDGGFSGNERELELNWLRGESEGVCRVLSNVRCLSEGVDVPNLDAAIFIAPRNSQVDVIQAVGRVMRKAPGKNFGYIILPIVVPSDEAPEEALDDNERYRVVWQTLNALRSHDERFRIMINQLQVGEKPSALLVDPPSEPGADGDNIDGTEPKPGSPDARQQTFFQTEFEKGLYAQIVKRCGDRNYLDQWAKDVAKMTSTRVDFIRQRLESPTDAQQAAFDALLESLQKEVNPNLTADDAIDFLTQHLTTLPVFDALFEENAFSRNNPVALRLQSVVDAFNLSLTAEEQAREEQFKQDVRAQIEGVTTADGRRAVIHKLYEQFFNVALPKTAEKLGVVYTPTEVVDYILQSVDYALRMEFGRRISNPSVHVLDPFTGTGAFISRLLESGLIDRKDLIRKYEKELHANEIMLLAYYIAAVNIEATYKGVLRNLNLSPDLIKEEDGAYRDATEFPGIVLTDTFQSTETPLPEDEPPTLIKKKRSNQKRLDRQRRTQIEVIVGNPPYSIGQKSGNDNNQNEKYPKLDQRVAETYAAKSNSGLKKSLYDTYVKAFRWATDRIVEKGIIGFVTNGAYIDNPTMEGFRKALVEEFAAIYVFNLRGNQRTSGELSRREGGKIFGSGSRAPIAITILVKKPRKEETKIYYRDIGDYLTREQKLAIIRETGSIETTHWGEIVPNEFGDWINQRGGDFSKLIPLGDKSDDAVKFFGTYALGVATNRDAWVYDYSKENLSTRLQGMIDFYNEQVNAYANCGEYVNPRDFVDSDASKISWTAGLLNNVKNNKRYSSDGTFAFRIGAYRPFCKENLFLDNVFNERPGKYASTLFPTPNTPNLMICIPNGGNKGLSTLITDVIPDIQYAFNGQCFPLYYYAPEEKNLYETEGEPTVDGYVQKSAITDGILMKCQDAYGNEVTREDIFFYVYGALHSPGYRRKYENDLKKELARLPLPAEKSLFWTYSEVGRALADLHVNYETGASTIPDRNGKPRVPLAPYPINVHIQNDAGLDDAELFRVDAKMRLGTRKEKQEDGSERKVFDGTLRYNDHIFITGIPIESFTYVVNGRSPVEWLVERYYRRLDKPSGIIDDPNLWAPENPRYIFDLIPRLIALSLKTLELTRDLPDLE
ncbi:MAG: DEAD/DEAH box helicase [Thermoguttaceae bacterium]|nr:DEAD/DEAH box helicase [Thermoguttaceae bacterium]